MRIFNFFFWYLLPIYWTLKPICAHDEPSGELIKEIDILKSTNDILKLRLEIMELKMEKQYQTIMRIDYRLQSIDEHLDKLEEAVASLLRPDKEPKVSTIYARNGREYDQLTILGENLFSKDKKSQQTGNNSRSVVEKTAVIIEMPGTKTPIMGKGETKLCTRNEQEQFVCSNLNLPNSCSTSNATNCCDNKCCIQSQLYGPTSFVVPCDFLTDDGGWTIIQRRVNSSVDFYRNWSDYKNGFGDLDGNYWLGLEKLHALTNALEPVELRVELQDWDDVQKYAKYDFFVIGDESTNYTLKKLGKYSGNAGDALLPHLGYKFATFDKDNEKKCAQTKHGAWWFHGCYHSNLNGKYYEKSDLTEDEFGMSWGYFHDSYYSLKSVQMKIRPKEL